MILGEYFDTPNPLIGAVACPLRSEGVGTPCCKNDRFCIGCNRNAVITENCAAECGKSLLQYLCGAIILFNVFATPLRGMRC